MRLTRKALSHFNGTVRPRRTARLRRFGRSKHLSTGIGFEDMYYQVEVFSEFDGVICSDWTNVIWIQVNNRTMAAPLCNTFRRRRPIHFTIPSIARRRWDLTFQWQSSTDGVIWTSIPGATASSYDPPSGIQDDSEYQVLITSTVNGVACTITSQLFQVNVMSLDPGTISEGQQICAGGDPDPLFADVPPSGEGALSYQWQETADLSEPWVDIPGFQRVGLQSARARS